MLVLGDAVADDEPKKRDLVVQAFFLMRVDKKLPSFLGNSLGPGVWRFGPHNPGQVVGTELGMGRRLASAPPAAHAVSALHRLLQCERMFCNIVADG